MENDRAHGYTRPLSMAVYVHTESNYRLCATAVRS
jgi:hypothetical protein